MKSILSQCGSNASHSTKMARSICMFIIFGAIPSLVRGSVSDIVRFENNNDFLNQKQPILSDRDGRFIRFDNKDTEIELELGVSVPFLKIPLKSGLESGGAPPDQRIALNPAGLLVGATLLLSTFLLVPLALPTISPDHSRSDVDQKHGGVAWNLMSEVNQLLSRYNLDLQSCSQKAICEFSAAARGGPIPALINQAMRLDFVNSALDGSRLIEFMNSGFTKSCDEIYTHCFLTPRHIASLPKLLGMW